MNLPSMPSQSPQSKDFVPNIFGNGSKSTKTQNMARAAAHSSSSQTSGMLSNYDKFERDS